MIKKQVEFEAYIDAFIVKVLAEQVYAPGNIGANSSYPMMRASVISLYSYNKPEGLDLNGFKLILDEQIKSILSFNNDISKFENKSSAELIELADEYSSLLENVLNPSSQAIYEGYQTKFKEFLTATKEFESTINGNDTNTIFASDFYTKLNTALLINMYEKIKDIPTNSYNENVNITEYINKWS